MANPLMNVRHLLNQIEQVCDDIAIRYGVQHLAGPQGFVLLYLDKHRDEDIFVKDIEAKLQISKSVASNLVKRMEKNGFISVVASEADKRYKKLSLTEEGINKLAPLQAFSDEIHHFFSSGISPEEFRIVRDVMKKLQLNVKEYKEETHA